MQEKGADIGGGADDEGECLHRNAGQHALRKGQIQLHQADILRQDRKGRLQVLPW